MNPLIKSIILVAIISAISYPQTLPTGFQQLLNKTHMQYALPPDFSPTPVIANDDVAYDFAIKSKSSLLEIRYRIWPIMANESNPIYKAMILTMGLNISNGKLPQSQDYPPESVKQEFGADAGCTAVVHTDSQFGKGYKFCMISVIHKDNAGDAYIFYLYNDPQSIVTALTTNKIFHALKFK